MTDPMLQIQPTQVEIPAVKPTAPATPAVETTPPAALIWGIVVLVVAVLVIAGIVFTVGISAEATPIIVSMFAFAAPAVLAFLAILQGNYNSKITKQASQQIQTVELKLDGRMEELIRTTKEASGQAATIIAQETARLLAIETTKEKDVLAAKTLDIALSLPAVTHVVRGGDEVVPTTGSNISDAIVANQTKAETAVVAIDEALTELPKKD